MFNCRNPGHHTWLVGFRFNVSATIPSGSPGHRRAPPDEFHFEHFRCKKGRNHFRPLPRRRLLGQDKCLSLRQDRCLLLRQDRCLLLRQDRCLLLRQDRCLLVGQGALLSYRFTSVFNVSAEDICPVSAANIFPVATTDIRPVSTEDVYPVSTEDITVASRRPAAVLLSVETGQDVFCWDRTDVCC